MPDDAKPAAPVEESSKLGRFITKYHTFLSSFVIGAAGLVATSIWQYRQSETARAQAEAQQKVAETNAANSWKIERAEILGKNLSVLASTGANSADQRYGVLLSLTRADILDPELTISYALELGKDNADYMQSVLANTSTKDYSRLAHAYVLSCEEKYGKSPAIEACNDKLGARSAAIGQMIADDVLAELGASKAATPNAHPGAMSLLKDERATQLGVQHLAGLFDIALTELYERRQWDDLAKFSAYSAGAHLVASLVLAAARTGELATENEVKLLDAFHAEQTRWLDEYLGSKACDAECKGRIVDVMVTRYAESQGDYDAALRKLLESPRAQAGIADARLHARLLWCQVSDDDLVPLRDHVLVPAAVDLLKPGGDAESLAALLNLIAAVPEPGAANPTAAAAWAQLMAQIDKGADRPAAKPTAKPADKLPVATKSMTKTMKDRREIVARQRAQPPRALRKLNFCAADTDAGDAQPDPTPDAAPAP